MTDASTTAVMGTTLNDTHKPSHSKVTDEFADKTLQRLLLDINTDLLKQTVAVLDHFDVATRMLSTDRSPSLHLVYPTKVQLLKKLQAKAGDGPVITELKRRLTGRLVEQYHIKSLHCRRHPVPAWTLLTD